MFWAPLERRNSFGEFSGRTVNVCSLGLSICSGSAWMVVPGSLITVSIFGQTKYEQTPDKALLQILARVCWVNRAEQVFGLQYVF